MDDIVMLWAPPALCCPKCLDSLLWETTRELILQEKVRAVHPANGRCEYASKAFVLAVPKIQAAMMEASDAAV